MKFYRVAGHCLRFKSVQRNRNFILYTIINNELCCHTWMLTKTSEEIDELFERRVVRKILNSDIDGWLA